MSSRYIPGYGYVDSAAPSSPGRSSSGATRVDTGQGTTRAIAPKTGRPKFDPVLPDSSAADEDTSTTAPKVRYDLTLPITYRPPVYGTADRQEQQIGNLPLVYRIQNQGDLREAYWGDPESRTIIEAAARVFYRDYPNYSDQWAKNFWQKDIMGAGSGDVPPWALLQQIFNGTSKASSSPDGSSSSSSYGGGGGGYSGGGGGGGGGQVSLTNPASARGLLMQTMQSVLGRDPTGNEVKTFLATLNETEMANPQTVSVEGDTVVGKGGTDPGLLAMEFAQDATDYKERQGDMYYQTFMRALAGGV